MLLPRRASFLLFIAFVFLNATAWLRGADAESRAFTSADEARQAGFHDRAERMFAEFTARYPASPRVAQALLLQSRAALAQKKFQPAIQLLATNLAVAAGIADQFQFDIANAYFEAGQYDAAATNFALLVARYTNSSLRLDATLSEVQARFQLRQWARVAELLRKPAGLFQETAARDPGSEPVVRGRLLLAESLLEQRSFSAAEQAARAIPEAGLATKKKWQREFLIARAQTGARQLEPALVTASNLVAIAVVTAEPPLDAASSALLGEILEALHRPEEAIGAYARNQRPGVPPERAREALFKTVELTIAQGRITNALASLQEFVAARPGESGSDIALLALAELRLKQYHLALKATNGAPTNIIAPGTDLLADAIFECDKLLAQFTNSPFASKARFVRGWALLAQGKTTESLSAFRAAADQLPWSEAQAVARFKTADLEFQSGDFTNALANYRRVLADYQALPRAQSELVPRARFQMLQASLAVRDVPAAEEVLRAIVREHPANGYAERSLLLFGQAVDALGDPARARQAFAEFVALAPNSSLRSEAELAVARSFEREGNWPGAVAQYDRWVTAFPTNVNLPNAEYRRALANFHAGRSTNALTLFTNFIARFPLNPLAARAQEWVGDYYLGAGQYDNALRNYQPVFLNTNWPVTSSSYAARLKAGRAALLRPSFKDAAFYFTNLINDSLHDPRCPTSVVVQAYFAHGDAYRQRRPLASLLENFSEARKIYEQVPRFFPSHPLAARAWGAMGECYLELGMEERSDYTNALNCFAKITNGLAADTSARQQAFVGLGHVFRRQSDLARKDGDIAGASTLLDDALKNYLEVLYPAAGDEAPDPLWVKEAMLAAAEVCELQGKWEQARNLYRSLGEKIPALQRGLAAKIERAQKQLDLQKP